MLTCFDGQGRRHRSGWAQCEWKSSASGVSTMVFTVNHAFLNVSMLSIFSPGGRPSGASRGACSTCCQSRASRTRLNGVSKVRRNRVKPALRNTSASLASPACAPSTRWPPSEIAWAQQMVVDAA